MITGDVSRLWPDDTEAPGEWVETLLEDVISGPTVTFGESIAAGTLAGLTFVEGKLCVRVANVGNGEGQTRTVDVPLEHVIQILR